MTWAMCGGKPGQDRVGDEYPAEVMGREGQWLAGGVGEPGPGERGVEHVAHGAGGDLPGLGAAAPLEQQRGRGLPEVLVAVVAAGQRDLPVWLPQPGGLRDADAVREDAGFWIRSESMGENRDGFLALTGIADWETSGGRDSCRR
jgi:hypothetical protein